MGQNQLLRQARLGKLWTIRDVAAKINMDERTVLRWELGQQIPRLTSLRDLTRVFEMSAKDLGFDMTVTQTTDDKNTYSLSTLEQTYASVTGNGNQKNLILQEIYLGSTSVSGGEVSSSDTDPSV